MDIFFLLICMKMKIDSIYRFLISSYCSLCFYIHISMIFWIFCRTSIFLMFLKYQQFPKAKQFCFLWLWTAIWLKLQALIPKNLLWHEVGILRIVYWFWIHFLFGIYFFYNMIVRAKIIDIFVIELIYW